MSGVDAELGRVKDSCRPCTSFLEVDADLAQGKSWYQTFLNMELTAFSFGVQVITCGAWLSEAGALGQVGAWPGGSFGVYRQSRTIAKALA